MSDMLDTATNLATQYYNDARNMLFGDGTTSLRFRGFTDDQGATITMDAVTNEEHGSELDIAENRLETGAKVSDHAAQQPKTVTVEGVVVGYETTSIQEDFFSAVTGLRSMDFLDDLPIPAVVDTVIDSTRDIVVNKLATFINWGGLDSAISQSLTPWLPDFSIAEQLKGSDNMRIEQMYRQFLDLQKNIVFCEVNTGIMVYDNMLLKSVRVTQEQDGSAKFTLGFKEVLFTPVVMVSAVSGKATGKPADKTASKSGRADTQTSDTKNRNINNSTSVAEQDKSKQMGVIPQAIKTINGLFGTTLPLQVF